jgi:hypothetical protein
VLAFRKATLHREFEELENLALTSFIVFAFLRSKIGDIMEQISYNLSKEGIRSVKTIEPMEDDEHDRIRYLHSPFSKCKGRKKWSACMKLVMETKVNQRRTCSYCLTKEVHNIRTYPKISTMNDLTLFFYYFISR